MKKYNGPLDYQDYVGIQIKRSGSKWNATTFNEILFTKIMLTALPEMVIALTKKCLNPDKVICMGIRNGNEYTTLNRLQKTFAPLEHSTFYGVDINPDVIKVGPNCFAYDFNDLPIEWANTFSLLYSNSLDHAFNIHETISEWWRVMKNDRYMLLTLPTETTVCKTDIYSFDKADIPLLFDNKRFEVTKIWQEYGQEKAKTFNILIRTKK